MSARVRARRSLPEKMRISSSKENSSQSFLTKHFNKIYPFVLHRSNSSSSVSLSSSLSLSLSQNSNESTLSDLYLYSSELGRGISFYTRPVALAKVRKEVPNGTVLGKKAQHGQSGEDDSVEELRRCNWITKSSGNIIALSTVKFKFLTNNKNEKNEVYVKFHDESWGVPVQLFELLAMSAMLMDYNWTEILKRKEVLREVFSEFDPTKVATMEENMILETVSNKALMLPESRIRCIVDNAKCILQVAMERGSFSNYVWEFVNFKPIINKYRYSRNVPLRSPKAESMSKDLLRRGFRFAGPVIVHSFMQAAGLSIDHLVDCYRFSECVKLSERPWRHV
ncbi:unnamed protein product [Rhodiola kirilowii]